MNRNFLLLWQGQLVSQFGSQVYRIALVFWVMAATDSASLMGLLMTLFSLPAVLLGPVGGTFADRHSRKAIIVVSDLINGLLVSAVAVALFLRPEALELQIALLCIGAIASGITQAFFRPAISAAIPDLVPADRLAPTLAWFQATMVLLGTIAGQAVGGVLYAALGAGLLFLLNGLTFVFSAASETLMHVPQKRPERDTTPGEALRTFLRETREGFVYVWNRKGMRQLTLTFGAINLFMGPVIVLFPFYVKDSLGRSAEWYGFLMAAAGTGAVIGFVLAGRLRLSGKLAGTVLTASMLGACGLMALAGQLTVPTQALGVLFVLSVLVAMVQILVMTLVHGTTPSEVRGRTVALLATMSGALSPLGMALGGVLGDLSGKNVPLIYALAGAGSAAAILLAALRREYWEFLASLPAQSRGE